MNITLFTNTFDFGGASQYFYRINKAFNEEKIKSEFIYFKNERVKEEKSFLEESFFKRVKYLAKKLEDNNSDILITNYGFETLLAKLASVFVKKKVKVISIVHIRSIMWVPDYKNKMKKYIFKSLLKLSFRLCDKCIAVSEGLRNEIIEEGWINPKKIITIYNPIIENDFKFTTKELKEKESIDLAIVGWIWDIKNQIEAIEALNNLNDNKYKLHIIGGIKDKRYKEKIDEKIKEYKLEDQVIFEGVKNNIFEELKNIDILLLSSKTEALPTVIIEAMATGTPVIARNCKFGPKEILKDDSGFVYDTLEELVKYIEVVGDDSKVYKEKSIKGVNRAKIFKYNKSVCEYNKQLM
ncbi:MAG: glycosyltransferase [Sarcina sp.]